MHANPLQTMLLICTVYYIKILYTSNVYSSAAVVNYCRKYLAFSVVEKRNGHICEEHGTDVGGTVEQTVCLPEEL